MDTPDSLFLPGFSALFSVTNIIVSNNVIAFAECSSSADVPARSVIFDIVSPGTVPAAILELLMFQSTRDLMKTARMDGFTLTRIIHHVIETRTRNRSFFFFLEKISLYIYIRVLIARRKNEGDFFRNRHLADPIRDRIKSAESSFASPPPREERERRGRESVIEIAEKVRLSLR